MPTSNIYLLYNIPNLMHLIENKGLFKYIQMIVNSYDVPRVIGILTP